MHKQIPCLPLLNKQRIVREIEANVQNQAKVVFVKALRRLGNQVILPSVFSHTRRIIKFYSYPALQTLSTLHILYV